MINPSSAAPFQSAARSSSSVPASGEAPSPWGVDSKGATVGGNSGMYSRLPALCRAVPADASAARKGSDGSLFCHRSAPGTNGMQLKKRVTVSAAQFAVPVKSPFPERTRIDDKAVNAWLATPEGAICSYQSIGERYNAGMTGAAENENAFLRAARGDGFGAGAVYATDWQETGKDGNVMWNRSWSAYGTDPPLPSSLYMSRVVHNGDTVDLELWTPQ